MFAINSAFCYQDIYYLALFYVFLCGSLFTAHIWLLLYKTTELHLLMPLKINSLITAAAAISEVTASLVALLPFTGKDRV